MVRVCSPCGSFGLCQNATPGWRPTEYWSANSGSPPSMLNSAMPWLLLFTPYTTISEPTNRSARLSPVTQLACTDTAVPFTTSLSKPTDTAHVSPMYWIWFKPVPTTVSCTMVAPFSTYASVTTSTAASISTPAIPSRSKSAKKSSACLAASKSRTPAVRESEPIQAVSWKPLARTAMLPAMDADPRAASVALLPISLVTAVCSSTAAAIADWFSLTCRIVAVIDAMADVASPEPA